MRSLGDVAKNLPFREVAQQYALKKRQLLEDPHVKQFLAGHPAMADQDIDLNISRLYQYAKDRRNCEACPGLEQCPNDFTGHYTVLYADRMDDRYLLRDHKVPCDKLKAQQAMDAVRKRITSFYIDDRALQGDYSEKDIITVDKARAFAADQVIEYVAAARTNGLPKKGLYLYGSFGTGKTFLMCYMLHELAKLGYSGVILFMPDFVEDLKTMISDPLKLQETITLLKETDVLIFDDIGAENLNPWVRDHVLGTILNYRMERKPTFYTSNFALEDLAKHFSFTSREGEDEYKGARLITRIEPFVQVVEVPGENKRGRQL